MNSLNEIDPNIIRQLGFSETWLTLLHDQTRGTAQITGMITIEGVIDHALFSNALNFLSQRYPQLCSRIILNKSGYFLQKDVDFKQIPLHYLEPPHTDSWQEIMQNEANSALPQDHYLWRAMLVSPKDQITPCHHIIITIHHAICDGLSLVAIFDSLLQFFNNPALCAEPLAIPAPIEKMYNNSTTMSKPQVKFDQVLCYQWPHQIPTELAKRATHFKFVVFSSTQVQQLQQLTKQHQVSINAMLNAAMLLAAQKILNQIFHGALSTAVSVRDVTQHQLTLQDIGFFCCSINTVHPDISGKTNFWQLAAAYQQQLRDLLGTLQFINNTLDFTALKKGMEFLWDPNRQYFCSDFMVSNLGMVNFPHESATYRIKAMRFGTCRIAGDNNLMLLVNSTRDGMFLTFGYGHPLITDEWAVLFIQHFKDLLEKVLIII